MLYRAYYIAHLFSLSFNFSVQFYSRVIVII